MMAVLLMAALIFFGYLKCIHLYHERQALRNLRLIEVAMEKYKQTHGNYPKYGEMWRTTQDVNAKLGISIKDDIFNYLCYGWTGWTSFCCETKSPLYSWRLHFHEGISIHCMGNDCPSCSASHDPKGGCY